MDDTRSRQVVIAGAGVAGLTAALAFSERGYLVRVFEQAPRLEAAGAGIQLSPNATWILRQFGVLDRLMPAAVRPEAVVLKDAATLRQLARVPLGEAAETRWQAPYLVAHRADLQRALMECLAERPDIDLVTGAQLRDVATDFGAITARAEIAGKTVEAGGFLLIGADGVWSSIRSLEVAARRVPPAKSRLRASLRGAPRSAPTVMPGRLRGCRRRRLRKHLPASRLPPCRLSGQPGRRFQPGRLRQRRDHRRDLVWPCRRKDPGKRHAWHRAGAATAGRGRRHVDGMANSHGRPAPALDLARRHRADRRCSACNDAVCGTGGGDGDRGCRNSGRLCRRLACRPCQRTCRLGTGAASAHRKGCPPGRTQPPRLACFGAGGDRPQPLPEDALTRKARRRSRLAVWLAGAGVLARHETRDGPAGQRSLCPSSIKKIPAVAVQRGATTLYSHIDKPSEAGSGFHQPVRRPATRNAAAVQVLQPTSALKWPLAS